MALQNRVDPYGRLHAIAARGTFMGNRGVLHDPDKQIVAAWRSRRWITCALSFKGRRREVFAPRRYSELFFLDEATSLAAGHRPCAECRRSRYKEFRTAWAQVNANLAPSDFPGADEIDRVLHAERVGRDGMKKTSEAVMSALPSGAMLEHQGRPFLLWEGRLRPWSFAGYGPAVDVAPTRAVLVLTPKSIVEAIRAGFIPHVHATAADGRGSPTVAACEQAIRSDS
jgi:hypothetical protein